MSSSTFSTETKNLKCAHIFYLKCDGGGFISGAMPCFEFERNIREAELNKNIFAHVVTFSNPA